MARNHVPEGSLCQELALLVERTHKDKRHGVLDIRVIQECVGKRYSIFATNEQQDAHEFLSTALNVIDEDLLIRLELPKLPELSPELKAVKKALDAKQKKKKKSDTSSTPGRPQTESGKMEQEEGEEEEFKTPNRPRPEPKPSSEPPPNTDRGDSHLDLDLDLDSDDLVDLDLMLLDTQPESEPESLTGHAEELKPMKKEEDRSLLPESGTGDGTKQTPSSVLGVRRERDLDILSDSAQTHEDGDSDAPSPKRRKLTVSEDAGLDISAMEVKSGMMMEDDHDDDDDDLKDREQKIQDESTGDDADDEKDGGPMLDLDPEQLAALKAWEAETYRKREEIEKIVCFSFDCLLMRAGLYVCSLAVCCCCC